MRTQRLFAYAFAVCLILLGTGSAIAADEPGNYNASLKGTYRIFTSVNNVGSTATSTLLGSLPTMATVTPGWQTAVRSLTLSIQAPPFSFEETGKFEYRVKRDGSFTQSGSFEV